MKNQIKKFLTLLSLVIILIFVIFVINQTATIVDLAENINSQFGKIVLYSLLVIYLIIVLVPLFILFRMPRKLIAPKIKNSPEYSKFEKKLAKRLSINKYVIDSGLNGDKLIIEDAINILDKKADDEIIQIAETVFVSTAISQSGRLDGIMVLLAQTRLVWRVAKIYNQRMLPVEIVRLYANVATTTFVVTAIEEEDIMERLGQIISGAIPSAIADFVPGLKSAADIISKSMLDGGANAYLTLRIGLICKSFLSYSDLDKSVIRKSASVGALSLLSDIVKRKGKE